MSERKLWSLCAKPERATPGRFEHASDLRDALIRNPAILSEDWMLIGHQEDMGKGQRADLIAIDADGIVRLIEVTNQTPSREAFLSLLSRADWLQNLSIDDLRAMYLRFHGTALDLDFAARFSSNLPSLPRRSKGALVLVTADDDPRVVTAAAFLRARGIDIVIIRYALFCLQDADDILLCDRPD